MTWLDGPLAGLDFETTGVDPLNDRIVSAAVVSIRPDGDAKITKTRSWIINPGVEIPAEAVAIHGITTEFAQNQGMEPRKALADICEVLNEARLPALLDIPLVGFNITFDLSILTAECRRHDLAVPTGWHLNFAPVLDPLVLDRHYDTYRRGSRKLMAMYATYGGHQESDAHDPTADVRTTLRLLWRMSQRYDEIRNASPMWLHQSQIEWHRQWAERYTDYLRCNVDSEAVEIDGSWPILGSLQEKEKQ